MNQLKRIANALRGLNAVEAKPEAGWVKALSPGEKKLAAERFREILPTALLKHHESRIARGKRSLATVQNGVCGGCHLRLPSGHRSKRAETPHDLDVCDNCGVFLEWPVPEDDATPAPATPPRKRTRRSEAASKK